MRLINSIKNKLNSKISWFFKLEPNVHKDVHNANLIFSKYLIFKHIKYFVTKYNEHACVSYKSSMSAQFGIVFNARLQKLRKQQKKGLSFAYAQ